MGAVSIDTNAGERRFETLYPMNTRLGVETFLENKNYIKESMILAGDFDAVILLIDFDIALKSSKLSENEMKALHLVFIKDLKRVDVAKMFGVTKQTIQKQLERATEKIAKYYAETGDYDATS